MARYHSLTIYHLARENLRDVAQLTSATRGFGDLGKQMRRASISTLPNICEGAANGHSPQFVRFLKIARASANELQGQLEIAADLGVLDSKHPVHDRCDHLGRAISKLIQYLSG